MARLTAGYRLLRDAALTARKKSWNMKRKSMKNRVKMPWMITTTMPTLIASPTVAAWKNDHDNVWRRRRHAGRS